MDCTIPPKSTSCCHWQLVYNKCNFKALPNLCIGQLVLTQEIAMLLGMVIFKQKFVF